MNKFNLTFCGEILPGRDPAQVKDRFARLFGIDDPERVEFFFTGEQVVLRRNLDRKVAAEYYAKLRKLGVQSELVKVDASWAAASRSPGSTPASDTSIEAAPAADSPAGQEKASSGPDTAALQAAAAEAQRKAEEETAKRQAAEQEAERKAQERKLKAEQAAQKRAQRQQARREAAEKATLERAQREKDKRKALEKKRQREEEEKARREHEKQLAAEKAAQEKAEREAASRKAAEEKRQREQAEKAQREQEKQAAADKAAREKAAREQKKRKAAKRKAAREEARRKAAEQEKAQREQEAAARAKAEREAEEQAAREQAEREAEQAAQRAAMEEQAIQRAARALADKPSLQSTRAGVRSSLAVPRRTDARDSLPRRRQTGEPNPYLLQAFRNSQEIRQRAAKAISSRKNSLTVGALGLALLLLIGGSYFGRQQAPAISGATAALADSQFRLTLLAGDHLLLHDRAGVGRDSLDFKTLGVQTLASPLHYAPDGHLFALGRLPDDAGDVVLRCALDSPDCTVFYRPEPEQQIVQLAPHPLSGELFLLDRGRGELLKLDGAGNIEARAPLAQPEQPVIRLESGLLFMNSPHGPAVSVFRYEASAFGQQLDEILLMPPAAAAQGHKQVSDFLFSGGNWWVVLSNTENDTAGLYRFDSQWDYLEQVQLPPGNHPGQLVSWGEKTLVLDQQQLQILRYNSSGQAEVPLQSDLLRELVDQQGQTRWLFNVAWQLALVTALLIATMGLGNALLQSARALVYRSLPSRGADPIDDLGDISWVGAIDKREQKMHRALAGCGVLALAVVLVAIGLGATLPQMVATLILLSGPCAALLVLRRQPTGHIGVCAEQLILVDQDHRYHHGGGPRLQHRGPFLLIDDVVVFTGTAAWPVFDPRQLEQLVSPKTRAGIRVDRKTIAIKLLDSGHPLAHGASIIVGCCTVAICLLLLQGIF